MIDLFVRGFWLGAGAGIAIYFLQQIEYGISLYLKRKFYVLKESRWYFALEQAKWRMAKKYRKVFANANA